VSKNVTYFKYFTEIFKIKATHVIKVEVDFGVGVSGSLESVRGQLLGLVSPADGPQAGRHVVAVRLERQPLHVGVEVLLLHDVASGYGHFEHGETGARTLLRVDPPLAAPVRDVRLVAAVELHLCSQVEGGYRRRCLEPLQVHVVLHAHLQDGVAGALCLHFHCAPRLGNLEWYE
jgi:hypothetical protein